MDTADEEMRDVCTVDGLCEVGADAKGAGEHMKSSERSRTMPSAGPPAIQDVPENCPGTTAFFVFSHVHRPAVRNWLQHRATYGESSKVSVSEIGKAIGGLWRECPQVIKERYAQQAKENRSRLEQLHKDSRIGNPEADENTATDKDPEAPVHFPRALVKRIVLLDEGQGRIASDALLAIGHAAEAFLTMLSTKSHNEALGAGRQTLTAQDVSSVLHRWRATAWPQSPFLSVQPASGQPHTIAQDKAMRDAAKGSRSLASFFAPAHS